MNPSLRKHPYWLISILAIVCATIYWTWWATDRYVSRANVVILSAQGGSNVVPALNFASILGASGSHDLLMLRDHLLSVDMLNKLDAALGLRAHYADERVDWFSRLYSRDVPIEEFHRYYLKRVSAEFDEYAQVLRVTGQAYDPETAQAIVTMLLREGEKHMNAMSKRVAAEQVMFIEAQVRELSERLTAAREAMLEYQNQHGLISPTNTAETVSAVVATLEGELAKAAAYRRALGASQSERSPEMVRLRHDIDALRNQIEIERARMAGQSGATLNRLSAEYENLRLQAVFAQEMYTGALTALENTRVDAARNLKQVSVLQKPTQPEYATEPKRLYNVTVFIILALLAGLITHLFAAIVRDHRD